MEDWDPLKMLNLYIHDYMIRKNLHGTAEVFATEANFCPTAVASNTPGGFLEDWWSNLNIKPAQISNLPQATENSSSKDEKYAASLKSSASTESTSHASKSIQPELEAHTGRDKVGNRIPLEGWPATGVCYPETTPVLNQQQPFSTPGISTNPFDHVDDNSKEKDLREVEQASGELILPAPASSTNPIFVDDDTKEIEMILFRIVK